MSELQTLPTHVVIFRALNQMIRRAREEGGQGVKELEEALESQAALLAQITGKDQYSYLQDGKSKS